MSTYPKIYKAEAFFFGEVYIALYEVRSGFEYTHAFRDGNGPNYLFEVNARDPACPGFTTLLAQARDYEFQNWEDLPYFERVVDGEAAFERHHMMSSGGQLIASWTGNAKKVTVHLDEDEPRLTRLIEWANK